MAAVGDPSIKTKLLKCHVVGDREYKVHLDGYNFLSHITGKSERGVRPNFIYTSDDGEILGVRVGDWKTVFMEQRAKGFDVWREPYVDLRVPKLFHLRRDPFERADTDAYNYDDWWVRRVPRLLEGGLNVTLFLSTFDHFPPRQRPLTLERLVEKFKNLPTQYEFKGY